MTASNPEHPLQKLFQQLDQTFGDLNWWPANSPYEVIVGAILTKNTAWTNVQKALANLKETRELSPQAVMSLPRYTLEKLITPAGFFRQKARYLHGISAYLIDHCDGDVARLCHGSLEEARKRLLALTGVGPETADSILLYAANRPSFVVDAYTRRILTRLGMIQGQETYDAIRQEFMTVLPAEAALFNQYHALIVEHAKTFCRKKRPLCPDCPLLADCPTGQLAGTRNKGRKTR